MAHNMPFRIHCRGLIVEVDTDLELRKAVDQLGLDAGNGWQPTVAQLAQPGVEDSGQQVGDQHWQQLVECFSTPQRARQRRALQIIQEHGDRGVSRADLVKTLKVGSPNALAGVISGVTKNAKRLGIKPDSVVSVQGDVYRAGKLLLEQPMPTAQADWVY